MVCSHRHNIIYNFTKFRNVLQTRKKIESTKTNKPIAPPYNLETRSLLTDD